MSLEKVQQALISKLTDAFPAWADRIAWPNLSFTATPGAPWLAFFFLGGDEHIKTLGASGYDEINGLVQIDVNYPIGKGESDSRAVVGALREAFTPGVIQYGGQPVTILARSKGVAATVDGFYNIPFTVRFRAQLDRASS